MKTGIYGGAFNPIHYGHLRTAEEVFYLMSLDKVLFMPSGRTPFDKPDLAKAEERFEMVKRAIRGNRHFGVSDIEVKTRTKSFTVDTIRKLRARESGKEFFFILGIDAFLDIGGWKEPDTLIQMTHLVVISRPGYAFADLSSSPYLRGVSRKALKELDMGEKSVLSFDISPTGKCCLCNVTRLHVSASGIRELIAAGREIRYLLPDSVKSYIISNKLYKNGK